MAAQAPATAAVKEEVKAPLNREYYYFLYCKCGHYIIDGDAEYTRNAPHCPKCAASPTMELIGFVLLFPGWAFPKKDKTAPQKSEAPQQRMEDESTVNNCP
jgi:hypothetical protein